MKNKGLKILCRALTAAAAVILVLSLCACESEEKDKYPAVTEKFFVNDYAGVISEQAAEEICQKGAVLSEKTGAQAVVAVIKSLSGEEPETFATALGRKWGIGQKDKNNGILILLAIDERQIFTAVGYGLEGALPDSKVGRITDYYALPYLKKDNFSDGVLGLYNAVLNEIYIEYDMPVPENYVSAEQIGKYETQKGASATSVVISWIILIVIVAVVMFLGRKKGIIFIGGPPRGGFGGFGGGNFRGGGGGFGGFHGGGGSFGGGGAGRGF